MTHSMPCLYPYTPVLVPPAPPHPLTPPPLLLPPPSWRARCFLVGLVDLSCATARTIAWVVSSAIVVHGPCGFNDSRVISVSDSAQYCTLYCVLLCSNFCVLVHWCMASQ